MTKHDDETAERPLLLAFHLQILGRIGQTGKYQCASMVAGHSVAHHYPACAFLASLGTYTPVAVSETPRMSADHVVAFCLLPVFLLASALVLFCRRKAHKTFWQCGAIGKYKPVFNRDSGSSSRRCRIGASDRSGKSQDHSEPRPAPACCLSRYFVNPRGTAAA
jgi:hypothetical protein